MAVVRGTQIKIRRGVMAMNLFGTRQKQLLRFLTANAERETLDYVLQGMLEVLGEEMPEEDAVRAKSWRWINCWSVRKSISECSAT